MYAPSNQTIQYRNAEMCVLLAESKPRENERLNCPYGERLYAGITYCLSKNVLLVFFSNIKQLIPIIVIFGRQYPDVHGL